MSAQKRLRVGVIGCGGIAQMMHLPYLASRPDRFEIAALADISPGVLRAMGERYRVSPEARFAKYEDLVAQDLDAVLILSGGDHYPQASAAIQAGRHVFSEKPLCFTLAEADALVEAAAAGGVKLMVGYMKRYDPGYLLAQKRLPAMGPVRYVQMNTLHPAEDDYLAIHNIVRYDDAPAETLAALREADGRRVREAVGDVSAQLRALYPNVFLGSMVHDTNAMRGLFGEPERVLFAELWPVDGDPVSITTLIQYPGECRVAYTWTYLPDLRNYFQEIAILTSTNRLRIQFPSPYLRHFPTPVVFEGMEDGAAFEQRFVVSYEEAFHRELDAFYASIAENTAPLTGAADARGDIRLLQQILAALHPAGLGGEAAG